MKRQEMPLPPLVQNGKKFKIIGHGERQFAALQSGFLTDVTILVGDEEIKCHSNIVSFASPKLSAMLQKNEEPRLPDVNPLHFRLLLQIIYMSETSEPQDVETLLQVGRVAHDLQVHPAAYFCAREVESALDTGNLWGILDYADLIDDTKLTKACFKIFRNNAGYILQTGGFLNCSGARIKSILRQETIYNVTELQLYQACVAWSKANSDEVETRRAELSSALQLIRFRKFSAEEFAEHVSPTGLLRAEDERDIYRSCVTGKNFMPEGFSESTSSSQIMVLELSSPGERKAFHEFPKNTETSLKLSISRDIFLHGVKLLAYRSNLPDGCNYEENVWITIHEKITSDFKQQEASFRGQVKKGEMISVKFKYPIEMRIVVPTVFMLPMLRVLTNI